MKADTRTAAPYARNRSARNGGDADDGDNRPTQTRPAASGSGSGGRSGGGSSGGGGSGRGTGGSDPSGAGRGRWKRILGYVVGVPLLLGIIGALMLAMAAVMASKRLPPVDVLTDYKPKVPMHIFTADGILIGEFGEERRTIVRMPEFPERMKQAILAAEDDRFYEHGGVDLQGIARAALANLAAGGRAQGASTITMQVARAFFLSREKSYLRKIYEILMSLKIEHALTKDQILEIYANQIFLGQRAYGFGAAAETYYSKPLKELSIAQMAMLAGIPKAPSAYNPIVNYKRARERQTYVINRMQLLNFITPAQAEEAKREDIKLKPHRPSLPMNAEWAAEMARQLVHERYKDDAYTSGLNIYTTIQSVDQKAANRAVTKGVLDFDRRKGYRGPEFEIDKIAADGKPELDEQIRDAISDVGDIGAFLAAVVLKADAKSVTVSRGNEASWDISGDNLKFVSKWLNPKAPANKQLKRGSVVRIFDGPNGWEIVQVPEVQASYLSISTQNGAVRSMVGGFDFSRSKFNRVTQSIRQPGSSIKPFIYSAALEKGFMTSTLVNDAPVIIDPTVTGGQLWEPKNSDGKFEGAMTMRMALARSRNTVSIRLLQNMGVDYAQDYLSRFGFSPERNPAYLTMALGAGSVTPWQLAGGMSAFANGGYRVQPYLIQRITDNDGKELARANPQAAGDEEYRIIDARNAYIIDSMLRDVVKKGTARKALVFKRGDLAGKTGTTNDAHDAWFTGYASDVLGVAWMGYDQPQSLGERETGGGLALPVWIDAMQEVLPKVAEKPRKMPKGITQMGDEIYYDEIRPGTGIGSLGVTEDGLGGIDGGKGRDSVRDQIF